MTPPLNQALSLNSLYPGLPARLAAMAHQARPTDLLSLCLPLEHWPAACPSGPGSLAWQRPDDRWLALGSACSVKSDGPGRFVALNAAWQGLHEHWRRGGDTGLEEALPLAHLGFAFHDHGSSQSLPNARLQVPALLVRERAGRRGLVLSCPAQGLAQALGQWEELWQKLWQPAPAQPAPLFTRAPSQLADQAFVARTRAALAAIGAGQLDKVVLSRRIRLLAEGAFDPRQVFAALATQQTGATVFAVGHATGTFLGATPERLLTLHHGHLETEALAGTGWGDDQTALASDKNQREHGWVAEAIRQHLAPLCQELHSAPAEVLQLPASQGKGLSHLRTPFRGRVQSAVSLLDLAARLHPTPAVGGWPAPAARQWLQDHGEERTCWYSGGLGWVDPTGNGTIAVPLRCANLQGREAELQAGAGIVAGSDPAQELAETEAKLSVMLAALTSPLAPALAKTSPRTGTR